MSDRMKQFIRTPLGVITCLVLLLCFAGIGAAVYSAFNPPAPPAPDATGLLLSGSTKTTVEFRKTSTPEYFETTGDPMFLNLFSAESKDYHELSPEEIDPESWFCRLVYHLPEGSEPQTITCLLGSDWFSISAPNGKIYRWNSQFDYEQRHMNMITTLIGERTGE